MCSRSTRSWSFASFQISLQPEHRHRTCGSGGVDELPAAAESCAAAESGAASREGSALGSTLDATLDTTLEATRRWDGRPCGRAHAEADGDEAGADGGADEGADGGAEDHEARAQWGGGSEPTHSGHVRLGDVRALEPVGRHSASTSDATLAPSVRKER